ncbi:MAG: FAD-dependent oxidoreductase [bacterium]|nr:FAD-dependent oxidoreductase [bacterium]
MPAARASTRWRRRSRRTPASTSRSASAASSSWRARRSKRRRCARWRRARPPPASRPSGSIAAALRAAEPRVTPAALGAARFAGDATVHSGRLVAALAAAAWKRGAVLVPGGEVHAAVRAGDRVARVRITDTWVAPGTVVLAAGAWTPRIAGLAPDVGVVPVPGQMLALAMPPAALRHVVMHADGCLTPQPPDEAWCGGTVEPQGFARAVTATGVATLLADLARIVPEAAGWPIRRLWAGIRPCAPAGGPLVGREPSLENLIVASGHYRNGILLAPIAAETVAALVAGTPPPPEAIPFLPA